MKTSWRFLKDNTKPTIRYTTGCVFELVIGSSLMNTNDGFFFNGYQNKTDRTEASEIPK